MPAKKPGVSPTVRKAKNKIKDTHNALRTVIHTEMKRNGENNLRNAPESIATIQSKYGDPKRSMAERQQQLLSDAVAIRKAKGNPNRSAAAKKGWETRKKKGK